MIINDGKKRAQMMVSKLLHGGDKVDMEVKPEGEMDDQMEALKSIAEEIMAALESKSASDFAHALKAFIMECESSQDNEG